MGKLTPKHCPKCGSTNLHIQELGSPHDYEEWYDVYCRDCEWSGDISPDLPSVPKKGKRARSRKRQASTVKGEIAVEEVRDYDLFIREEKLAPEEAKDLKTLKREALRGEYVPLEEVLKKHGVKKRA
jgi:hypothetical protein